MRCWCHRQRHLHGVEPNSRQRPRIVGNCLVSLASPTGRVQPKLRQLLLLHGANHGSAELIARQQFTATGEQRLPSAWTSVPSPRSASSRKWGAPVASRRWDGIARIPCRARWRRRASHRDPIAVGASRVGGVGKQMAAAAVASTTAALHPAQLLCVKPVHRSSGSSCSNCRQWPHATRSHWGGVQCTVPALTSARPVWSWA